TKAGRPKPTKEDPYAGLVQLAEVKPKSSRVAAAVSNGDGPLVDTSSQPSREVSEAIMRARERRLSAGYNRRAVSQ
ncbi:MAG: hypothetical protein M3Y37_05860, partial [Chloroflexota bacterium]|nr:hypothetical protein [Chloroflexota bacterium]